jgi:genome maintenance exonuclease 1
MFPHEQFTFPKLQQKNLASGRVYEVVDTGECFPSITRVLGARPKPALENWKRRVGAKEATRISTQSSTRGTALHSLAEHYLNNDDINLPDDDDTVREYWAQLSTWIDDNLNVVHAQEQDVYSQRLHVAGRMDLLATVNAELAVVDFKTSRKRKKEEYVQDYYLQGCFYALSVFEQTGMKVTRIIFPIVSVDGFQIFETTPAAHYTTLRHRIKEYYDVYHEGTSHA